MPAKVLPKPQGDTAGGVRRVGRLPGDWRPSLARGRFFTQAEDEAAAAVAVLGQAAAAGFFGAEDPVGRFVKVNEQWYRVIGVAAPRLAVQGESAGCRRRTATT